MSKTVFALKGDESDAEIERRKRILCADNHEDTRAMMTILLDECGYEVITAGSVTETLSLTERGDFDLLILDSWFMDGLGVDLCKQVRALNACAPIIFLSAYAYPTEIRKGLEAGAQAYLTKPFEYNELKQTIEKFIL